MQLRRPTRSRSRVVGVNAVLALVLVAALAGAYLAIGRSGGSEPASLRTVAVTKGTVTATVNGTGNLTSTTVTTVSPQTSGTLLSVAVAAGDAVTKGQVLARIDPTDAQTALASAQAEYDVASAQYDETAAGQTSASRTKDRLAVDAAQLQVAAAEQAVKDAKSGGTTASGSAGASPAATGTSSATSAASLTQAKQQLASAELQLEQAKAQAQADAAGATAAQLAQASASVTSAKASLQSAKDAVAATTVRAPVAGTVLSVGAVAGDRVSPSSASSGGAATGSGTSGASSSSSSSSSSGTSGSASGSGLVVIADLTSMQVTAQVAEADAAAVSVGQSAQVTLPASGDTVAGTVTAVALQGTTTNNVVQYPVTVRLATVPDGVRLGASATVTITTGSREGVLTVPTSAITTLGTTSTLTVLSGGRQSTVEVTKGLSGGSTTEVSGDIAAGDQVVLPSGSSGGSTGVPGGLARLGGFSGVPR